MEILPILSAMRRNKVGAVLVAMQMAVTLAILCNALFIIQQRLEGSARPSGADEANVLAISNNGSAIHRTSPRWSRRTWPRCARCPGWWMRYVTNSYPLTNSGWGDGADLKPDQRTSSAHMARYFGDEHSSQPWD